MFCFAASARACSRFGRKSVRCGLARPSASAASTALLGRRARGVAKRGDGAEACCQILPSEQYSPIWRGRKVWDVAAASTWDETARADALAQNVRRSPLRMIEFCGETRLDPCCLVCRAIPSFLRLPRRRRACEVRFLEHRSQGRHPALGPQPADLRFPFRRSRRQKQTRCDLNGLVVRHKLGLVSPNLDSVRRAIQSHMKSKSLCRISSQSGAMH